MLLTASQTGLYQAYNLAQQFPNEWWHLKQTKSAQLTLGLQHLPFFLQGHAPAIATVKWYARVNGSPAAGLLAVDAGNVTLSIDPDLAGYYSGLSAVTLGTPFILASTDPASLEELTMLVHYTIGS
jgi:hypothetical protein